MADQQLTSDELTDRYRRAVDAIAERRIGFRTGREADDNAVKYTQGRHAELNGQLAFLEAIAARLKEQVNDMGERLEGSMRYRGVFQRADRYSRNDCTTHDGALWFCLRDCNGADAKPGSPESGANWQMMTKAR